MRSEQALNTLTPSFSITTAILNIGTLMPENANGRETGWIMYKHEQKSNGLIHNTGTLYMPTPLNMSIEFLAPIECRKRKHHGAGNLKNIK